MPLNLSTILDDSMTRHAFLFVLGLSISSVSFAQDQSSFDAIATSCASFSENISSLGNATALVAPYSVDQALSLSEAAESAGLVYLNCIHILDLLAIEQITQDKDPKSQIRRYIEARLAIIPYASEDIIGTRIETTGQLLNTMPRSSWEKVAKLVRNLRQYKENLREVSLTFGKRKNTHARHER